jgi:hypothetical protein
MTSSIKYLLAPGKTKPAKRLMTIRTSPNEITLLLGQTMVLKTCAIEILFFGFDLDLGSILLKFI